MKRKLDDEFEERAYYGPLHIVGAQLLTLITRNKFWDHLPTRERLAKIGWPSTTLMHNSG